MTVLGGDRSLMFALGKSMDASFPAVLAELIQEAVKENPDFKKIARIMSLDPALSATVISLVNSPFYGLSQEVHDLQRAAVVLGKKEILKLVLSVSFQNKFTEQLKKSGQDVFANWSLLAWSATGAQLLAPFLCPGKESKVYLCTLLKDISLLLMCAHFPERLQVHAADTPLLAYHCGQLESESKNWG
ncbi:MAG: HDOD domain-containing protein, partial [Desulfovibrionales bacterium]